MFLVLLPSFSSFFHIPTTYFTLCIHASFPSCWTNSAYLQHENWLSTKPFLLASLYLLNYFQPFFLGLSSPGLGTSLARMVLPRMDSSHSPVAPGAGGALAGLCCPPGCLWVSSTSCTHWFPSHMGREGALLPDPSKGRNVVRDDAVDYPSPADTRVESQAPMSRFLLSVLALLYLWFNFLFPDLFCTSCIVSQKGTSLTEALSCNASVITWPAGTQGASFPGLLERDLPAS